MEMGEEKILYAILRLINSYRIYRERKGRERNIGVLMGERNQVYHR
jgi:hypothetical protein